MISHVDTKPRSRTCSAGHYFNFRDGYGDCSSLLILCGTESAWREPVPQVRVYGGLTALFEPRHFRFQRIKNPRSFELLSPHAISDIVVPPLVFVAREAQADQGLIEESAIISELIPIVWRNPTRSIEFAFKEMRRRNDRR